VKKPWNLFNAPVYSLATEADGLNMNICTYVTAVSLHPKLYGVAVYRGTKTLQNLDRDATPVLQLLSRAQIDLVNTLGRKSGVHYDKERYLRKKAVLTKWNDRTVLQHSAALISLRTVSQINTGDHVTFFFEVVASRSLSPEVLMLDDLRQRKLIRN